MVTWDVKEKKWNGETVKWCHAYCHPAGKGQLKIVTGDMPRAVKNGEL